MTDYLNIIFKEHHEFITDNIENTGSLELNKPIAIQK
jgi:hypothetical protein